MKNICLYCGKEGNPEVCNCYSAIRSRTIDIQIDELEDSRPKEKYILRNGILLKKNPNEQR